MGLVKIKADNELDAAFALGFAHAQDRLWQMDFWRRTGSGRLSEVIGSATVPVDRFMRTLGLKRVAEENLARLSPEVVALLESYSDGVNAFMEQHSGPWPPAFLILGYDPEPWAPVDSVLWGRMMAFQLSNNWRSELKRAAAEARLPATVAADLWPRDRIDDPVMLKADAKEVLEGLPFIQLANALPPWLHPRDASNAWTIDGSKSNTGQPILANDPHLELSAPGAWYMVHIEAGNSLQVGVTAPGGPFLVLGHNGKLAWGVTTTHSDTQDLFIEKLAPGKDGYYLTPGGAQPFEVRDEIIKVKNDEDITLTIRESRHGPIISDILQDDWAGAADDRVLALAWPALLPDDKTTEALYEMARAESWSGFRHALRKFHSPQQNILYADTSGTTAFIAPARLPMRLKGDGRRPVPGWSGDYDWQGFVPFDDLPQNLNPRDEILVSANNRIVGPDYPHLVTADWPAGFRARRIEEKLANQPKFSPAEVAALQLDIYSSGAAHLLPILLDLTDRNEDNEDALEVLGTWDFAMDRHATEPIIYYAWITALNEILISDELGELWRDFQRPDAAVIAQILTESPQWCDDIATIELTESCREAVTSALDEGLGYLRKRFQTRMDRWRWGKAHNAPFDHPIFSRVPFFGDLLSYGLEVDGGDTTINRGGARFGGNGDTLFQSVHGAGFRAVYDLSNLENSRFMIATGQSGNPLSPYYGNFTSAWQNGESFVLNGASSSGDDVLTLQPQ